MENSDDIRLIVKIAQLYYEQDMTQAQIARELGQMDALHASIQPAGPSTVKALRHTGRSAA